MQTIVLIDRSNDALWFLAGIGVVQIDQRLAVDGSRQQRKAGAQRLDIKSRRGAVNGYTIAHDREVGKRSISMLVSASSKAGLPIESSAARQNAIVSNDRASASTMPRERM